MRTHWLRSILLGLIVALGGACTSDSGDKKPDNEFLKSLDQDAEKLAAEARRKRAAAEAEQERRERLRQEQLAEQREAVAEAYQRRLAQPEQVTPRPQKDESAPEVEYVMSDEDQKMFKRILLGKIQQASDGASISMSFDEGVVTLFGEVKSREIRRQVIADLKSTPGVVKVNADQLVVKGQ
ncbi:MAG: BON domain-containing protein [Acidobacteria bacterium]|nr:BON domain-containing protein [Acidobacteriota bacterium]